MAEKRKQEAINKRRQYEISEKKDLAEYDTLSDWPDLYGFKFSYYYQNNRLNIMNKEAGKTISVMSNRWTSEDYSVEEKNINGENYQNIVDTPILFRNQDKIEIYFIDKKIKLAFNV